MTRFLKGLAGIQAAVLVALAAIWWQRAGALPAPPHATVRAPAGDAPSASGEAVASATGAAASVAAAAPAAGEVVRDDAAAGGSTVVLHGRLLGLAPRNTATIELCASAGEGGTPVRATVKGDEYAIAGLVPGIWRVSCRVHRHHDLDVDCTLTGSPLQRCDLTLVPILALPVVLVTPAGRDLRSAFNDARILVPAFSVVASVDPIADELPPIEYAYYSHFGIGRHRQHADLDPSEHWNPDGFLELAQPPPVYAALLLRHLVIARHRVMPGQREVRFAVDTNDVLPQLASVRLRAVDASGRPLAGARLSIGVLPGVSLNGQPVATGTLAVRNLPPGFAPLTVVAPGHESLLLGAVLTRGEQRDLGDVVLQSVVALQGKLVADDDASTPLAGAVQWVAIDPWRAPQPLPRQRGTARRGGVFGMDGAGARRYLVQGATDDGRFGSVITDGVERRDPFPVVLRRATTVRFCWSGSDTRGCTVVVRTPDASPVHVVAFAAAPRVQPRPLVPGTYRLEVFDGFGVALSTRSLTVGESPIEVEVP